MINFLARLYKHMVLILFFMSLAFIVLGSVAFLASPKEHVIQNWFLIYALIGAIASLPAFGLAALAVQNNELLSDIASTQRALLAATYAEAPKSEPEIQPFNSKM